MSLNSAFPYTVACSVIAFLCIVSRARYAALFLQPLLITWKVRRKAAGLKGLARKQACAVDDLFDATKILQGIQESHSGAQNQCKLCGMRRCLPRRLATLMHVILILPKSH